MLRHLGVSRNSAEIAQQDDIAGDLTNTEMSFGPESNGQQQAVADSWAEDPEVPQAVADFCAGQDLHIACRRAHFSPYVRVLALDSVAYRTSPKVLGSTVSPF